MSLVELLGVIDAGDYSHDGRSLYYILEVEEETAHVENCDTLFSADVPHETIINHWVRLDFHAERQTRRKPRRVLTNA